MPPEAEAEVHRGRYRQGGGAAVVRTSQRGKGREGLKLGFVGFIYVSALAVVGTWGLYI